MAILRPTPSEWSENLPAELKLNIADSIVAFSRMETALIEALWAIESADLTRKQKISRDFIKQNINKMRQHVEGLPNAKTEAIWQALQQLLDERNIISHGYWLWSEGRPLVVWHSKFLEEDSAVGAEWFDIARFERFLIKVNHLRALFDNMKALIESSRRPIRNKI